ncbi:MAG: hypothetical protein HYW48_08240 [Deltaproteobacteria bacterium]|nr:hypothetical protein [Deltaproteobacteria bacterium]
MGKPLGARRRFGGNCAAGSSKKCLGGATVPSPPHPPTPPSPPICPKWLTHYLAQLVPPRKALGKEGRLRTMRVLSTILLGLCVLLGCETTPLGSSEPINESERLLYQQELIRCNKTGGSRVVKIKGKLHCF